MPIATISHPARCRRARHRRADAPAAVDQRRPAPAGSSTLMTWTSIPRDAAEDVVDDRSPDELGRAVTGRWRRGRAGWRSPRRAKSVSGRRDVGPDDLVVGAAEALEQGPVLVQALDRALGEAVARAARGRRCRSPRVRVAMRAARRMSWSPLGRAGERDDHPLARLPRVEDAVRGLVLVEGLVDLVGDPHQGQLAERTEVAEPEVVAEGGIDLLRRRRCCRGPSAGAGPPGPCRRARPGRRCRATSSGIVSRCVTPVMRSTTSLSDSRCWMLSVEMTSMPGVAELLDVLPPLLVAGAGGVGVGELVDEGHGRRPADHRLGVHLLERRAPVGDRPAGDDLEPLELRRGVRAPVGLDVGRPRRRCRARPGGGPR